jgi:hypothetical protein
VAANPVASGRQPGRSVVRGRAMLAIGEFVVLVSLVALMASILRALRPRT